MELACRKIILKNPRYNNVQEMEVTHCKMKLVRNDMSRTSELRANVKKILR